MIAEDEESPIIVLAKLKGLIVRDLFGQIAKNIRSEKKFFLRLCPDGIRMFFFELGKETEIEINLRKDMFPVYSYLVEGRHIYKFDIKEFEFAGLFFENTTIPLTLKFTSTDVQFSNQHQLIGSQYYEITAQHYDQQYIPSQILDTRNEREGQKYTKMTISKTKMLSNQLHTLGLLKVQNVQIWINKEPNLIQLTPVGEPPGVKTMSTLIPIQLVQPAQIQKKIQFSVKRLKSGLSLFDKNSMLLLQFYENCVQLQMISNDKKSIVISIAALAEMEM